MDGLPIATGNDHG